MVIVPKKSLELMTLVHFFKRILWMSGTPSSENMPQKTAD
jgi:hypothetical protein